LYFVLPIEQPVSIQSQAINVQAIGNKKTITIVNEPRNVVSLIKSSNELRNKANTINNNELKENKPKINTSKKQNIRDLIAQIDKTQTVSENSVKQNSATAIIASKTNDTFANQKIIDNQKGTLNNTFVQKNNPITEISFSSDQTVCKGDKVKLSVNGGVSYLWSTGEKTQYIIVNPTSSVNYSVIASDENGNRKTGLISVTVSNCEALYVPNAFTPNGDGQSDIFKAYGNAVSKFEIIIVSRSGQVVYTSKNINEGWDGNIKGNAAPMGVYVYTIKYTNELKNEQTLTGHVTLIK
jgi:gliding motility-associated-like protein